MTTFNSSSSRLSLALASLAPSKLTLCVVVVVEEELCKLRRSAWVLLLMLFCSASVACNCVFLAVSA